VAARVAAVPYDVVDASEARALASGNPLSFLHVSRAEIDLPADVDPYSDRVYQTAATNFARLRETAPLVTDDEPGVYLYRLRMGAHVQTGVAACFSVDEYDHDIIRKHERTRRDKEDDRTRHILELRAQTGPVFLTYKAAPTVDTLVAQTTAGPPLVDVTAADGVQHTLWRAADTAAGALVAAFAGIPALYIADGHHRAASAARARQQLRAEAGGRPGEWDAFLAVAFPDREMQILPYNRAIKDLGGETAESLLAKIGLVHAVSDGEASPRGRGEVGMYLAGRWHTIRLADDPASTAPDRRLDVSRLQDTVLEPLLGIGDVRSDPRIGFVGGARGTAALEAMVNTGAAAVAFSMYPVSVDDLMAISDAGGIMPPKSTWFEPKLRDGLLSHEI